jgi:hypothetical protein
MQGEAGNERQLRRIIALLVAFAGLAERAAGCSYPVRFLLLLVLRHAEAIARDYVAQIMLVDGLWFDDAMECTSSPADAELLARRFGILAAELQDLLAPAGLVVQENRETAASLHRACRRAAPRAPRFAAILSDQAAAPRFHDTS